MSGRSGTAGLRLVDQGDGARAPGVDGQELADGERIDAILRAGSDSDGDDRPRAADGNDMPQRRGARGNAMLLEDGLCALSSCLACLHDMPRKDRLARPGGSLLPGGLREGACPISRR